MYRTRNPQCATLAMAAALATTVSSAAQWGSLRANNHSFHAEAGAARGHENRPVAGERREALHSFAPAPSIAANRARELDQGRHAEIDREIHDRRHLDIAEDRWRGFHWYGFHPGMILPTLPEGYLSIAVGGSPYYYDQGVYYTAGPSGYVVAVPPVGAVVPALPPGAEPVVAGPLVYYYAGGAFYQQQPQGFVVIPPPIGVTIPALPAGAVPVVINGVEYYQAGNAYFLPSMQAGVTVYTVVQP